MLRASAVRGAVLHLTVALAGEDFPLQAQTGIFCGFKVIYEADARWMMLQHFYTDPDHSECICQCQCHHYPPTCPPQTAFILHRLEIDQDVACVVDLTSDPALQSLCPAS